MNRWIALAFSLPFAGPALAEGIVLASPIACDLARDCYIQQYVDQDPGPGSQDYHCAGLSYDGHKGTDFAVPTLAAMERGVRVIASAAGVVKGVRDGMPDTGITAATADQIKNRECGNGVLIDHGDGWETQYCHLRQGSVAVAQGQKITTGDVLGLVGQSGNAAFPHVHLSVRRQGAVVDPFDPDGTLSCTTPGDSSLWAVPPLYRPGGLIEIGFADHVPKYDAIKAGRGASTDLTTAAPALVVYGYLFGSRAGDTLHLSIEGPQGVVIEDNVALTKPQAQSFRAIGKKRRDAAWPLGEYNGTVSLLRGSEVIDRMATTLTLR